MQLNELLTLEPATDPSRVGMPLKVKDNSLTEEVSTIGLNIEELFTEVPLEINNRLDALLHTKGLKIISSVNLAIVKDKLVIGFLDSPNGGIMFFKLDLKGYKEDEFTHRIIPPTEEIYAMYESMRFGSLDNVKKLIEMLFDFEYLNKETCNLIMSKLNNY